MYPSSGLRPSRGTFWRCIFSPKTAQKFFSIPLSTNDCFPKLKENKMIFENLFGLFPKGSMRVPVFWFPGQKRGFYLKIEFLRTKKFLPPDWPTSCMVNNSVTVRATRLTLLVVKATSILLKIYPIHRGYIPPFYIIVYLCLGRNPCMSRDVLGGVTLSPTQDCHLMCFFGPTSRLD